MVRGPCKFTQRDLTRTLKAARTVKIEMEDRKMNWMIEGGRGCASA
jgi:hypothetical protein